MTLLSTLISSAIAGATGPQGATGSIASPVNNPVVFANTVTFQTSYVEKAQTSSISSSTVTFDLSKASVFNVTLNSDITTMNITNAASSGNVSSFVVVLQYTATSYAVTWNAAIKWPSGNAPTLTNSDGQKDVFVFFTTDGGTSYQGFTSGQNL